MPTTTRPDVNAQTVGTPPYARDLAASATILGFGAVAWFGWGSRIAPDWASAVLATLMALAALVGMLAVRARRAAPEGTLHHGVGLRSWWLWLIVEVVAIVAGGAVLVANGHPLYVICWTHLVMGLHFLPLAHTYRIVTLTWTGVACSAIAIIAAAAQAFAGVSAGLTVGGLGGLTMVVAALVMIGQAGARTRASA